MQQTIEQQTTQFNSIFDKHKLENDRHQSLYIFVISNLRVETTIEKVKKIITIVDSGTNPSKKAYLKTKLNNFIDTLLGILPETIINKIFFVSKSVDQYDITDFWKETLQMFNCDQFIVKHDDTFQLEWLKGLLLDRTYVNVICLNNNNLKHFYLNHTKKTFFKEKEEKKMDLNVYVQENTNKGEITIIHGISSFLKGLKDTEHLKILNNYTKDEDILEEYDKILNIKNADQLQWWLDRLLDPKEGKKIAFGKDIGIGINECMIKLIFCSPERKKKLLENYPDNNLSDKLLVVKSFGNDVGLRLVTEFKGAVGIRFY